MNFFKIITDFLFFLLFLCDRFVTREAFMRKVMNHQNFTHYPFVMQLIKDVEKLFAEIQQMER